MDTVLVIALLGLAGTAWMHMSGEARTGKVFAAAMGVLVVMMAMSDANANETQDTYHCGSPNDLYEINVYDMGLESSNATIKTASGEFFWVYDKDASHVDAMIVVTRSLRSGDHYLVIKEHEKIFDTRLTFSINLTTETFSFRINNHKDEGICF